MNEKEKKLMKERLTKKGESNNVEIENFLISFKFNWENLGSKIPFRIS